MPGALAKTGASGLALHTGPAPFFHGCGQHRGASVTVCFTPAQPCTDLMIGILDNAEARYAFNSERVCRISFFVWAGGVVAAVVIGTLDGASERGHSRGGPRRNSVPDARWAARFPVYSPNTSDLDAEHRLTACKILASPRLSACGPVRASNGQTGRPRATPSPAALRPTRPPAPQPSPVWFRRLP